MGLKRLKLPIFLTNGKLEEMIYMRQLKGYVAAGKEDWVWELHKTLYGL